MLSLSLCFSLSLLPSFPCSLFLSFIHLIVISLLPSLLWKCLFVFVFKVLVVLKSIGQLFYTVSPVGVCPIFAQDCIQSMFFWDRNIREVVSCLSECTTSGGTRLSCSVWSMFNFDDLSTVLSAMFLYCKAPLFLLCRSWVPCGKIFWDYGIILSLIIFCSLVLT